MVRLGQASLSPPFLAVVSGGERRLSAVWLVSGDGVVMGDGELFLPGGRQRAADQDRHGFGPPVNAPSFSSFSRIVPEVASAN